MQETEALTEKLGVKMQVSIEQRMAGAAKVGSIKRRCFDLEAGRPLELKAIVGGVGGGRKNRPSYAAHPQCLRLYQVTGRAP